MMVDNGGYGGVGPGGSISFLLGAQEGHFQG